MSQGLGIHPTIIDPSTGEPLIAIDIIKGIAVWPVFGAEGEDGSDDSEGSTEQSSEEDGTESGDQDAEEAESQEGETVPKTEHDRLIARMKAADRRASALETKVKEFEKQGQTETERLQSELSESQKLAEQRAEALQAERIANAFLAANDVTWHDPNDALAMLRANFMDGVEIDENGVVQGMKDAIKKMAKTKKYLVSSGDTSTSSTADGMNGKRKGDAGNTQSGKDEELKKRMPALGRGAL